MGTTADKLNKILQTKEAIRTAINNKGGTLTETDTFASYATAIDNIQSGGDSLKTFFDTTKSAKGFFNGTADYSQSIFYNATNETISLLLNYSDTENVKDFSFMFVDCRGITSAPNIDTSNATIMSAMFRNCKNLVDVSQLNIIENAGKNGMFYGCEKLTTLPKTINNRYDIDLNYMFNDCHLLERVDIYCLSSQFTDFNRQVFGYCYSLKKLIIRNMDHGIPPIYENIFAGCLHFYGTTDATYNPEGLKDGRIYVPDDKVEALKVATNWSVFADIIVPLSTLVEE